MSFGLSLSLEVVPLFQMQGTATGYRSFLYLMGALKEISLESIYANIECALIVTPFEFFKYKGRCSIKISRT